MKGELTVFEFRQILKSLVKGIIRKWLSILITAVIFAGIGFTTAKLTKSYYLSRLTFYIDDEMNNIGLLGFASIAQELQLPESSNFSNKRTLLMELLNSREISTRTFFKKAQFGDNETFIIQEYLRLFGLPEDFKEKYKIKDESSIFLNADRTNLSRIQNRIVDFVYKTLIVEEIEVEEKVGGMVEVVHKSDEEEFAYILINNHIESLLEFYERDRLKTATNSYNYLVNKKDSIEMLLTSAEISFARFEDSKQRLVRAEGYIERERIKRKIEILNSLLVETSKTIEFAKMNLNSQRSIVKIIDRPILPLNYIVPPIIIYSGIGGAFGFFLSFIFVFIFELLKINAEREKLIKSTS